jgi:hypothetical protein
MKDTIFILSTKLIFVLKTPYGWGARGGKKKNKKKKDHE